MFSGGIGRQLSSPKGGGIPEIRGLSTQNNLRLGLKIFRCNLVSSVFWWYLCPF